MLTPHTLVYLLLTALSVIGTLSVLALRFNKANRVLRRKYAIIKAMNTQLIEAEKATRENYRVEREIYEEWNKELYDHLKQQWIIFEANNKLIKEKEDTANYLEAQLSAIKTLHLN